MVTAWVWQGLLAAVFIGVPHVAPKAGDLPAYYVDRSPAI